VRFAADVVDNEGAPRPTRAASCRGALPRHAPRPLCAQGHVLLLTHASGDRPGSVNSCWAWFVSLVRCELAEGGLLTFPGLSSFP
jgi:hypothetical protein